MAHPPPFPQTRTVETVRAQFEYSCGCSFEMTKKGKDFRNHKDRRLNPYGVSVSPWPPSNQTPPAIPIPDAARLWMVSHHCQFESPARIIDNRSAETFWRLVVFSATPLLHATASGLAVSAIFALGCAW